MMKRVVRTYCSYCSTYENTEFKHKNTEQEDRLQMNEEDIDYILTKKGWDIRPDAYICPRCSNDKGGEHNDK